jgi:hypothetical protein
MEGWQLRMCRHTSRANCTGGGVDMGGGEQRGAGQGGQDRVVFCEGVGTQEG